MPDTIVPLVRRPVRRLSATPDTKDLTSATRKLSIGGDSSSGVERLRRSVTPRENTPSLSSRKDVDRETTTSYSSRKVEETSSYSSRKVEVKETSSYSSRKEEVKDTSKSTNYVKAGNCFPATNKDKLPSLKVARNRPIKTSKDLELERKVLQWIVSVIKDKPDTDFDRWIQDGSILSRVMINIVFNSVPVEQVHANWGSNPVLERVKCLIHEMRRYGVTEMFQPEDLMELRNIPLVTKSLAQLCKLATADCSNLLC